MKTRDGQKAKKTGVPERMIEGFLTENQMQTAEALYPGKQRREIKEILSKGLWQKLRGAFLLAIGLLLCSFVIPGGAQDGTIIIHRPEGNVGSITKALLIESSKGWKELLLEIHARGYTEEELEKLHKQIEEYLDTVILADNETWERIETDLYFPKTLPDGFAVSWSTDAMWLVSAEGKIRNEEIETERDVLIRAKITYGEEFRVYERTVTILPKRYTEEEQRINEIVAAIKKQESESRSTGHAVIPRELNGRIIKEKEEKQGRARLLLVVLAGLIPVGAYLAYFEHQEQEKKKRQKQAVQAYTEFVTKLTLTLVAGVSVRHAITRLSKEYTMNYGPDYVLAQELNVTRQEIENGKAEQEAYEAFGNRMGLVSYQRLASLLGQSVSKGVQDIRTLLFMETKEVTAQERANIRIRGEQAASKLLFPMMGFLMIIFAVLLVPAFQMF